MKFSEQWLREWVDPSISSDELVAQLTMAGLEVDEVTPVAGAFSGVRVGRIESCEPHPDADRLKVCEVNDGSDQRLQIVCGAPNARPGLVAPLAMIGAVLPGDLKITAQKLRGVPSQGMLCSAKELGLSDDAAGLMPLPDDAPIGQDLREYLNLNDLSIDVDLTPNRADCLSIVGLARDVAAANSLQAKAVEHPKVPASHDQTVDVRLTDSVGCPRYVGRVIRGIDPAAETPFWLQEKLRRCGVRAISPVVDITNYVLLELGQPMHGFDFDKLQGDVDVRRAKPGESLVLLDDSNADLDESFLLITDDSGPIAVAGVMGGLGTSVTDQTTNVFFESAYFDPATITGRARKLGLHTDASHRYERGVDPNLQEIAIERATELLIEIAGGEAGPVVEAKAEEHLPERHPVTLRRPQIKRILGCEIADSDVEAILSGLGMQLQAKDDGWSVQPPSSRFDIAIEVDLIEEIGRIYGYNRLPMRSPQGKLPEISLPEARLELNQLKSLLVARGYQEAVNYSFISDGELAAIDDAGKPFPLANPLSTDLSHMRHALAPGLLKSLVFNQNRQQSRVRLFETGVVFPTDSGVVNEQRRVAGLCSGSAAPEQWGEAEREIDFFDIKSDVEALLAQRAVGSEKARFVRSERSYLHPGQSADVWLGDVCVGWIGALHPSWVKKAGGKGKIYGFELSEDSLIATRIPNFQPLSKFPSVRRDLALLVKQSVSWSEIQQSVQEVAGNLLTELVVFDDYTGSGIEQGYRSLALGLVLQDAARTLTDQDIDAAVDAVVARLRDDYGAELRG